MIASNAFMDAAEKQAAGLGLPEMHRVFVPHPIQDATDDEIRDKTDVIIDRVDRGVDELNCHRVGESAIRPAFISERLIASGS